MKLTNEQLSILFDKINEHLAYAKHQGTENYTDKIVFRTMNLFSGIELLGQNDFEKFWDLIEDDFTFETLKAIEANDLLVIIEKTINNSKTEISEVKGLFKGGKISKIKEKYCNQFLETLNANGGIDYLTDNYFAPYVLSNYRNKIDFGF